MYSMQYEDVVKQGILVKNAGIVLVNNYIDRLFNITNLTRGGEFLDADSQIKAVHLLQYVSTGMVNSEEQLLLLNKVLCGIQLTKSVGDGMMLSTEMKEEVESMISAIIGHWSSIGKSSVEGFRGNWLVRDGILREEEDRWQLHIEKRSYDILIQNSPFSFSIIKLPWMDKPLHVNWSY